MFCFINSNWRARPLVTYEVILEIIRLTQTKTGLNIQAMLDEHDYETGKKITDEQMRSVDIQGDAFHPEWNYTICPHG